VCRKHALLKHVQLAADIFVGNQHLAADLPQAWWSTAFASAIKEIGHTVLVLQPWHAPVPLERSWCLVRRSVRAARYFAP
jgi:hypothetical protein